MKKPRTVFVALLILMGTAGCVDSRVGVVRRFNDARDRGDLEEARTLMAPDARVWYENPTSEGEPWALGGEGKYAAWDKEFRSRKSIVGDYEVDGDWVWVISDETNDYYQLTERRWSRVYLAWKVNEEMKVCGLLVAQVGEPRSRAKEFREWAKASEPAEYDYLFPDGTMDVTGDRAARMRALLNRWRAAVGLPASPNTGGG